MNDFGVWAELRRAIDHAIVETRADRKNHVGVVHRQVGGVAAMHAQHADELAISARVGTQPHQRVGDRGVQLLRQFGQWRRTVAHDHAATGVDDRAFGRHQHFHGLADLSRVATDRRAVGAQLGFLGEDVFELFRRVGHVFRDIDDDRTRTTGLSEVKRFFQDFRDFRRVLDHEAVLHDRPGDTDHVGFLERVGTDHVARNLAGQHHHRNRIHVGGRDTRNGVGCAGT